MSRELQVGDFVRCRDKADFAYEHNGETGLWLEVTYVEKD